MILYMEKFEDHLLNTLLREVREVRDMKNCSIIYLSQSYYKTPKDVRILWSHFCICEFPSSGEKSMICNENKIDQDILNSVTSVPYSFNHEKKLLLKKLYYVIIWVIKMVYSHIIFLIIN